VSSPSSHTVCTRSCKVRYSNNSPDSKCRIVDDHLPCYIDAWCQQPPLFLGASYMSSFSALDWRSEPPLGSSSLCMRADTHSHYRQRGTPGGTSHGLLHDLMCANPVCNMQGLKSAARNAAGPCLGECLYTALGPLKEVGICRTTSLLTWRSPNPKARVGDYQVR